MATHKRHRLVFKAPPECRISTSRGGVCPRFFGSSCLKTVYPPSACEEEKIELALERHSPVPRLPVTPRCSAYERSYKARLSTFLCSRMRANPEIAFHSVPGANRHRVGSTGYSYRRALEYTCLFFFSSFFSTLLRQLLVIECGDKLRLWYVRGDSSKPRKLNAPKRKER